MRPLSGGIAGMHGVRAWLAVHNGEQTSHVVYRFDDVPADIGEAIVPLVDFEQAHVLSIEQTGVDTIGRLLVRTPYTGNQQQWIRLSDVLQAKGGQMAAPEAERAVMHLLEASEAAHRVGLVHGEIDMSRVLVDRHGRVQVELYGLDRVIRGLRGSSAELRRDEVRSIALIAYTLITGMEPSDPPIAPSRLVKKLSRSWESWLMRGLDPTDGFDSASEAISALPSLTTDEPTPTVRVVRSVLRSFGSGGSARRTS